MGCLERVPSRISGGPVDFVPSAMAPRLYWLRPQYSPRDVPSI
jgi:hypothetical protein